MSTQLHPGQPSFLDIQLHEGYPFPSKGHRITFFNPNTGVMIAHYQDVVQSVGKVDNDKIRLEFSPDFVSLYKPETKRAVRIGNLICLEVCDPGRLISLRETALWVVVDGSEDSCFAAS